MSKEELIFVETGDPHIIKANSLSPIHSYLLFSLTVILLIYVASYFQSKNFVSGVLITEFVFVIVPAILLVKYLKLDIKSTFRFNYVSTKNVFLSIGILLFSLPLISIFNIIYILIVKRVFGSISVDKIPIAENIPQLLLYFLVIGLSAGLCEEFLFRGCIMKGLEKLGTVKALLISSILFGVLHLKIEKFPATFILGLIIGFAVFRTNSIYTGMAMHFANNSLATFFAFFLAKIVNIRPKEEVNFDQLPNLDSLFGSGEERIIIMMIFSAFIVLTISIFSTIVYFLVQALIQNTSTTQITQNQQFTKKDVRDLLYLIPGIVCIVLISSL